MTQSGHQEAFNFDRIRLCYQRYDGLPHKPAQIREQLFLELHLPFWRSLEYSTKSTRSLVEYAGWDIEPIRLFRLLTLKAAPILRLSPRRCRSVDVRE